MPAVEICSERSAAGMIIFCTGDVVIFDEDDVELLVDSGVAVDFARDAADELDDIFGDCIAGSGFSCKNHHALDFAGVGICL